jgi:hypothetical protein
MAGWRPGQFGEIVLLAIALVGSTAGVALIWKVMWR